MKFIEDLRDTDKKHEKIYVVGASPRLDDYPDDWFQDKICIGVNWVFVAFFDIAEEERFTCKKFYSVHEHREPADWIRDNRPDLLKQCIFLLPPKRRKHPPMVWWEDYNEDPYYMRWGLVGRGAVNATRDDFEKMARCIMANNPYYPCYYVCLGTTLHWAIDAAVVLGAKKIYVVGAEARCQENKRHAQKRGLANFYKEPPGAKYSTKILRPDWLQGTRMLAEVFKPYGVEIVQYYYETGEVKLA